MAGSQYPQITHVLKKDLDVTQTQFKAFRDPKIVKIWYLGLFQEHSGFVVFTK